MVTLNRIYTRTGDKGSTRLATGATVVAFDRDPTVRRFAADLPSDRFRLVDGRFSEMDAVLGQASADGVALAAIQGLNQKLEEKERRIQTMERELAALKEIVTRLSNQRE